jgi:hypothetical protein
LKKKIICVSVIEDESYKDVKEKEDDQVNYYIEGEDN